jgi:hypothetical protein
VDQDADGACNPGAPSTGPSGCIGTDNCPTTANPGQEDINMNAIGDACDADLPGDSDGDGYDDTMEGGTPLCLGDVSDDAVVGGVFTVDDFKVNDGCPAWGPAEINCDDALDNDADSRINDGCPMDGGYSEHSFRIGTNYRARCGVGFMITAWPSDLASGGLPNSTDRVNILDVTSFLAGLRRLDTSPGDFYYHQRWDLAPGRGTFMTWINIADLSALLAGPSGFPPMFGGVRAFDGPACTPHPVYGD